MNMTENNIIYSKFDFKAVVPGIYRSWCLTHDDRKGRVVSIEPREPGSPHLWVRVVGDRGYNLNHLIAWLDVNTLSRIMVDDFVPATHDEMLEAFKQGHVVRLHDAEDAEYYVRSQNLIVSDGRVVVQKTPLCIIDHTLSGCQNYLDSEQILNHATKCSVERKERPHA